MRGDGRNMGGKNRVGRQAEGLFGARGASRAARPKCDSYPPLSFSLKGALRFRRVHTALTRRASDKSVWTRVVPQHSASRHTTAASSSTHASLKAKRRSCSANHGSGGEGWLPRQTRNVPAPRPRTAPAGGEGRSRGGGRGGGCTHVCYALASFYNLCELEGIVNGEQGVNFLLVGVDITACDWVFISLLLLFFCSSDRWITYQVVNRPMSSEYCKDMRR